MQKNSKILILGSTGLVGSAVVRELQRKGYDNLVLPTRKEYDLRDQRQTHVLFNVHSENLDEPIEYVFNGAAHSGGILEAIEKPAEMLYDNLLIQTNVIETSELMGVKKLLNFASSCIYPVNGKQPYREEQIGEGKTDENWSYAVAKIAGIEMCRAYNKQYGCNFLSVVPCNVYGINDDFSERGHVVPALIRKVYNSDGGDIGIWGNGEEKREFIYSDDLAKACVLLMEKYDYADLHDGIINVGTNSEIKIYKLARIVAEQIKGKAGRTIYEMNESFGVKAKLMDSTRIRELGWKPEVSLEEGIKYVCEWYKEQN